MRVLLLLTFMLQLLPGSLPAEAARAHCVEMGSGHEHPAAPAHHGGEGAAVPQECDHCPPSDCELQSHCTSGVLAWLGAEVQVVAVPAAVTTEAPRSASAVHARSLPAPSQPPQPRLT